MFSSIRSKLIGILTILWVLPFLIGGYLSYQSASNAILVQTKEQLGNVADKTAQQIDNFFEMAKKDIDLLSDFPFIQLSFLQFEFGQRLDTVRTLLEDYMKKNNYYHRIYLIDLNGKTILSVPDKQGGTADDFSSSGWFRSTLAKGIYLSDVIIEKKFSQPVMMLSKMIYDFENPARAVGVLAFDIKLTSFTGFVASLKIGTRGYAFLLNKQGYMLYHPDKNLALKKSYMVSGDTRLKRLIERMKSGERGFGDYLFNDVEKYMVFTPCRVKDWSVGITLHRSELMADIYQLRRRMTTFIFVIVGLILPVSYVFVRSITRPVRQLITGARAIGSGDLDQIITIKSNDELQGLAKEFNRMASKLKTSMGEILELKRFRDDIFRSVTSGIMTVDKEGNLTSVNKSAEKILNYSREGSRTKRPESVPEQVKEILNLLSETLVSREKIQNQELAISKNDEALVYVEVNTSLLKDQTGKVVGAIADIRDITRRKRMEELMVRVDKLASLGELSAGMAHEIRNPLAGIKTSVQILAKKIKRGSEGILIDGILDEIDRLDKIVTDLLRFSRPSPPVFASTDLTVILEKTFDLVSEKIRLNRISLYRRYDQHVPPVMIDQEQIQQVFLNLLLNALKAMPEGGDLTVSLKMIKDRTRFMEKISEARSWNRHHETDFVEVVFKDTGDGIEKEDLPKIFNPFYTTDPGGTGLGLSIVHKLMEKNNGYIYIDSVKGKGTHVTLLLPTSGR